MRGVIISKVQILNEISSSIDCSDTDFDLNFNSYIDEFKSKIKVKFIHRHFDLQVSENSIRLFGTDMVMVDPKIVNYLSRASKCLLSAITLGNDVDNFIKHLQYADLQKAVLFDSISRAYLESAMKIYEGSVLRASAPHIGYGRFTPKYGDLPLHIYYDIAHLLSIHQTLGVHIEDIYKMSCCNMAAITGLYIPSIQPTSGINFLS